MTGKPDTGYIMSVAEYAETSLLIVEPDSQFRGNLKQSIRSLGLGQVTDVANHAAGLDKIQDRKITHVIFDAKKTNMPAKEFLAKVLELEEDAVCIPASLEPSVDDVFDMLIMGARGFLVKPFTVDTVNAAIVCASKGEPIADVVKQAKDRNEALVAIMMSSLDKVATLLRQARQFETAQVEIPRAMAQFRRSADLAVTFAKGGDEGLFDAIEKFCLERSKGPATRLGRLRKRLKKADDPAPAET